MQKSELTNLINALKEGIVNVTFTKVGTSEVRLMQSTLNPEKLTEAGIDTVSDTVNDESSVIPVWCVDKNGWRSFRVDTVTAWEKV